MGALFLGPRLGKYSKDGKPRAIPGHSMPLALLGVFILWFGWFGFNPGSTMAATTSIGDIAMTTNLAAAAGALAAMGAVWVVGRKPDVGMTANGALAGLVGITAACAFVENWAAVVIGMLAGVIVVFSAMLFDRIHVDAPLARSRCVRSAEPLGLWQSDCSRHRGSSKRPASDRPAFCTAAE
jgi:Amt family ammonium transporter